MEAGFPLNNRPKGAENTPGLGQYSSDRPLLKQCMFSIHWKTGLTQSYATRIDSSWWIKNQSGGYNLYNKNGWVHIFFVQKI